MRSINTGIIIVYIQDGIYDHNNQPRNSDITFLINLIEVFTRFIKEISIVMENEVICFL